MKEILKRPKVSLVLLAGIILPLVALICSLALFSEEKVDFNS